MPTTPPKPTSTTAVAIHEKSVMNLPQLRAVLDGKMMLEIARALPPTMRGHQQRLVRCMVTQLQANPFLQTCTVPSLLGCIVTASQLGLEIGGPLGQSYMVPYRNNKIGLFQAQLQVGYRGYINLAHRGGAKNLFAHAVRQSDVFKYRLGTSPRVEHVPPLADRGDVIGYYGVLVTGGGGKDVEIASLSEMQKHRVRYSKKQDRQSPWDTHFDEMATKTLLRRLGKRAPVSVDMQKAATLDEYADEDVDQDMAAVGLEAVVQAEKADGEVVDAEWTTAGQGDRLEDDGDPEQDGSRG